MQLSHCLLKLNFSGNEIANVAPIVKLIRLKELCLADNNIESLIAWQGTVLPALHTLDLSGNKIHSLQALLLPLVPPGGRPRPYTAADGTALVNVLPSLRVLRLAGNPVVVGVPGYHLELFKHHPQLAVIDNWCAHMLTILL